MKPVLRGVFVACVAVALNARATTPIITSQPHSQTVNLASTAHFSVVADNAATYQWKFEGQAIVGATSSELTLEDVTNSQAGSYSVAVASSTLDSTNSQPAQLTIVPGTIVQLTFSGYATGASSNVVLALFDHDKPATVQNFLHYITSGAFSNLFWTRLVPGFVLQGGDYTSIDRTNGPPPSLNSVENTYTFNVGLTPPFPYQIDNEFGVGPLIHNTFGTIAMAKTASGPDSATAAFFFNLNDNSANLDNQNGGFTVFGRILSGTNVLDYFNTFSVATVFDQGGASGPTNGIFNSGQDPFTAVPVNYHAVTTPGDSNFFYVDFAFPAPPVLDTNLPTIAVVYPTNNVTATNGDVIVNGTAADDVGLARVVVTVLGAGYNGGGPVDLEAIGTTNWSADFGILPPGSYSLYAVSQDGAGNLATLSLTTFVVPQFLLNVYTNGPGTLSTNLNQANVVVGSTYVVKAIPAKGALFLNWTASTSSSTNVSINPSDTFVLPNGLQLTAAFVPNTLPKGISFAFPSANAKVSTTNVVVTGKVAASAGPTTITAQIFSQTSEDAVSVPLVTQGSTTWALPAVQLAPGQYIVQALASNALGKTTVISESFTVLTPLSVTVVGPGKTSIADGTFLQSGVKYSIRATPNPGELFYTWNGPSGITVGATLTFTNANGVALIATFISNALPKQISFTSPGANSQVAANNITLTGTVSPSVNGPQIVCQLFLAGTPVTGLQTAAINGTTWSSPFSNLRQGNYTAVAILTDSAGRQTLISENFKVNFFPNIAGTYYGIFFASPVATNDVGLVKFILSSSGLISGKMQMPFFTYILPPFQLDSLGRAFLQGRGLYGYPIYFSFNFDLTNGTYSMNGDVYSFGNTAPVIAYRAVTQLPANTQAGRYLLSLETLTNTAPIGPTNDGYATLSVGATGALALGGTLSDNTVFSEGVGVSKDGVWPVYATLYRGQGVLVGWETNVIGANGAAGSTGVLYWVKNPTQDTYFTNGFSILAASTGTNYVAPVPGTQYQVVFGGGSISPALNNTLTVSNSKQFVPAPGAPDKLTISLSSAGAITGKIFNPADGQTLQIRGAFTSPSLGGAGFILDPDGQSEPFQITLVP